MLKLYFARPSGYARPVWLALLEKELPFELISVDLRGGQFEPEFLAISPFGHVPVLVDGNVSLFEMTAILDYLEARYPEPTLQAQTPLGKGQVRLVQSVTFSELLPALFGLLKHEPETEAWIDARSRAETVLQVLTQLLAERQYLVEDALSIADITAGSLVYRLCEFGIELPESLAQWSERLRARSSWQAIELEATEWQNFKRVMRVMPKLWQRRRLERLRTYSS